MISVIIPTYNERENIKPLFSRLIASLKYIESEVIVVDDNSPDKTWKEAEKPTDLNLRVIRRFNQRGLSSAILRGFDAAQGEIICVMDADLSHPPEIIPEAISVMKNNDIVIASRYYGRGGVSNWSASRRLVSHIATLLARPVANTSDPMSGFFFVKKGFIDKIKIKPRGFKILLDIVASPNQKRISEIPYTFLPRVRGNSKMSIKTIFQYPYQLTLLYLRRINNIIS